MSSKYWIGRRGIIVKTAKHDSDAFPDFTLFLTFDEIMEMPVTCNGDLLKAVSIIISTVTGNNDVLSLLILAELFKANSLRSFYPVSKNAT